jgi:hypothetical protein
MVDESNQVAKPNREGPMADAATWLSWELWRRSGQQSTNLGPLADAIVGDPQAHIDALVEAGVLFEASRGFNGRTLERIETLYKVPKPHVHDWQITKAITGPKVVTLFWICLTCDSGERSTCLAPDVPGTWM